MRRFDKFESNVENFKRRRALPAWGGVDADSRIFFERLVYIKKNREFVFITKARSKDR